MTPEPSNPADWRNRAACLGIDPDLFFPTVGQSTTEAKRVCRSCETRQECLDDCLMYEAGGKRHGIFGGMSGRERETYVRRHPAARTLPPVRIRADEPVRLNVVVRLDDRRGVA